MKSFLFSLAFLSGLLWVKGFEQDEFDNSLLRFFEDSDSQENYVEEQDPDIPRFTCTEDGFYALPGICDLFIVCMNKLPFVLPCSSGLHFNNATQECEQPCTAHCDESIACDCKWPTCNTQEKHVEKPEWDVSKLKCPAGGFYTFPGYCELFIVCLNKVPIVLPCLPGLHFNNVTRACEEPCSAHCDESIACECKWPTCKKNSTLLSESVAKFDCPPENYTFPDPDNCGNYIQCYENGTSEVHSCPSGQHFNYALKHCTAPCDAYCDETMACQCEWPTCKKNTALHSETFAKFVCPPQNYTFPDPDNCGNYIQCYENGTSELHSCPSGQHFNYALKRCTDPCDAYCDDQIACKCGWPTCKKNSTLRAEAFAKFVCPPENYTFPDPDNCGNYIQCYENGTSELHSCPSGQHFNYALKHCTSPCDAYCDETMACECQWPTCKKNSTLRSQSFVKFDCPPENYTFPDPDNCGNYIQCYENGTSEIHSCPSGQHFNYALKHCTAPCDAYCDETIACDCEWPTCKKNSTLRSEITAKFVCPSENYKFPYPDSCENYIQCYENGTSEVRSCPSGQHFNYALRACMAPCDAYCDEKSACECNWLICKKNSILRSEAFVKFDCPPENYTFPDPNNCGNYIQCYENGTSELHSCPSGQHFNYALKHCTAPCDAYCDEKLACECDWPTCKKPTSSLSSFKCDYDGLFSIRNSCTKYIKCSRGFKYDLTCPVGTHFNKETLRCENTCDAHCDEDLACECGWPTCGDSKQERNSENLEEDHHVNRARNSEDSLDFFSEPARFLSYVPIFF